MRIYFKITLALLMWGSIFLQSLGDAMSDTSKTNRLAREKSPYLLQHAHNPVDWFPWGPEAFEKARKTTWAYSLSTRSFTYFF